MFYQGLARWQIFKIRWSAYNVEEARFRPKNIPRCEDRLLGRFFAVARFTYDYGGRVSAVLGGFRNFQVRNINDMCFSFNCYRLNKVGPRVPIVCDFYSHGTCFRVRLFDLLSIDRQGLGTAHTVWVSSEGILYYRYTLHVCFTVFIFWHVCGFYLFWYLNAGVDSFGVHLWGLLIVVCGFVYARR